MAQLYIGNLPENCSEDFLHERFSSHGSIKEILPKGKFAFLTYEDPSAADQAIRHEKELLDREDPSGGLILDVELANKQARPMKGPVTLHLLNLPSTVDWEMLQGKLKSVGPVQKAYLAEDGEEGVKRGIVTYELKEDAQAAIDQLHETNFEGARLQVICPEPGPNSPLKQEKTRIRKAGGVSGSTNGADSTGRKRSSEDSSYPVRLAVPSNMIGAIIGKEGKTIRKITDSTGARVDIHRKENAHSLKKEITVFGNPDTCNRAIAMILKIMQDERATLNRPQKGPFNHGVLELIAHNDLLQKIFGPNKEFLVDLTRRTNTDIIITTSDELGKKATQDRHIVIDGPMEGCCTAQREISELYNIAFHQDMQRIVEMTKNGGGTGFSTHTPSYNQSPPSPTISPCNRQVYRSRSSERSSEMLQQDDLLQLSYKINRLNEVEKERLRALTDESSPYSPIRPQKFSTPAPFLHDAQQGYSPFRKNRSIDPRTPLSDSYQNSYNGAGSYHAMHASHLNSGSGHMNGSSHLNGHSGSSHMNGSSSHMNGSGHLNGGSHHTSMPTPRQHYARYTDTPLVPHSPFVPQSPGSGIHQLKENFRDLGISSNLYDSGIQVSPSFSESMYNSMQQQDAVRRMSFGERRRFNDSYCSSLGNSTPSDQYSFLGAGDDADHGSILRGQWSSGENQQPQQPCSGVFENPNLLQRELQEQMAGYLGSSSYTSDRNSDRGCNMNSDLARGMLNFWEQEIPDTVAQRVATVREIMEAQTGTQIFLDSGKQAGLKTIRAVGSPSSLGSLQSNIRKACKEAIGGLI